MRGGKAVNTRAKLNLYETHLVIDKVGEGDEGVYIIKNPDNPDDVKQIKLIIRGTECVSPWHLRHNWCEKG